jgi:hypothetical protein
MICCLPSAKGAAPNEPEKIMSEAIYQFFLHPSVNRTCQKAEDYQLIQTATDSTCNVENNEEERRGMK